LLTGLKVINNENCTRAVNSRKESLIRIILIRTKLSSSIAVIYTRRANSSWIKNRCHVKQELFFIMAWLHYQNKIVLTFVINYDNTQKRFICSTGDMWFWAVHINSVSLYASVEPQRHKNMKNWFRRWSSAVAELKLLMLERHALKGPRQLPLFTFDGKEPLAAVEEEWGQELGPVLQKMTPWWPPYLYFFYYFHYIRTSHTSVFKWYSLQACFLIRVLGWFSWIFKTKSCF
jgi:hypothetical protein